MANGLAEPGLEEEIQQLIVFLRTSVQILRESQIRGSDLGVFFRVLPHF